MAVRSPFMSHGDLPTLAQVLARYSDGPASGVFTDGGSVPNPGPGGWGAVYVVDGDNQQPDGAGGSHQRL
jgi:hypothetical protein